MLDWRIRAAERETRSMSVPVRTSSSFTEALFSMPSKRLLMWLHTLRRAAICLDFAKYMRALTELVPLSTHNSIGRCLKSRLSVPCLPVTSTFLDLIVILTPLGILTDSSETKVFIFHWGTDRLATLPYTEKPQLDNLS